MFACRKTRHPSFGAAFQGKTPYSTTGSLDSGFSEMVQKHCSRYENIFMDYPNHIVFIWNLRPERRILSVRSLAQHWLALWRWQQGGNGVKTSWTTWRYTAFKNDHKPLKILRLVHCRRYWKRWNTRVLWYLMPKARKCCSNWNRLIIWFPNFGRSKSDNLGRKLINAKWI